MIAWMAPTLPGSRLMGTWAGAGDCRRCATTWATSLAYCDSSWRRSLFAWSWSDFISDCCRERRDRSLSRACLVATARSLADVLFVKRETAYEIEEDENSSPMIESGCA